MNAVTAGMIVVEGGPVIQDILDFTMEVKKNNHSRVRIKGTVPEETGMLPAFKSLVGNVLNIFVTDDKKTQLFCGFLYDLQISRMGNLYVAEIEGVSSTEALDRERKCRSFQDTEMTYKEMVKEVLADTAGAQVIFLAEDKKIGAPVYQYQETDWEFLKRIASHLGTSLLPAEISPKPALYFGLHNGKERKEEDFSIEKVWFDRSYYHFLRRAEQKRKAAFICRTLTSYRKWEIGDRVSIGGTAGSVIIGICGRLQNGLLVWKYTAGGAEAFGMPGYENEAIAGVSLPGTVLETRGESIKVWLDIDREQSVEKAFYYPWIPETGSFMYCMPEVGERVLITFDDERGNARGSCCIRGNGTGNRETQDPSEKYFTTAEKKRLYLLPEKMGMTDLQQSTPLRMELNDRSGIRIESQHKISLLAKQGIRLQAETVTFRAPQEISVIRRDIAEPTVLNLCNGFDCIGKFGKICMEDDGNGEFPIIMPGGEAYDISGAEEAVTASTPRMAGRTKLERQITGTKVDTAG